jgi:hypothetical protein
MLSATFSLAAGWINPLIFRSVPLDTDWRQVREDLQVLGIALPSLGIMCAVPKKFWGGAWLGAVAAGIVIASITVIQGENKIPLAGSVTFFIVLAPIITMLLPFTILLRWLLEQQTAVVSGEVKPGWLHQVKLLALLLIIAAVPAFTRIYSPLERRALLAVQAVLQENVSTTPRRIPEVLLEARQAHAGQPYNLLAQRDPDANLGVHIQVTFPDGGQIHCSTLVQPTYVYFDSCQPGGYER